MSVNFLRLGFCVWASVFFSGVKERSLFFGLFWNVYCVLGIAGGFGVIVTNGIGMGEISN